jgi:hypothetical protein
MSRDAFSYDPQDTGDCAIRPRAAPPLSKDRHLQMRGTTGTRRPEPLTVAPSPGFESNIRHARNGTIPPAPIT